MLKPLTLEQRKQVLANLRERFAVVPAGVSLADELIALRRLESAAEERLDQRRA